VIPSKIRTLLPYAIVVFLGYVGFSLPLPVLPALFLNSETSILSPSTSVEMKTILLGLVLAAYPSGQLIGSPLLGLLSDRWGRKKVILFSLASTAIGYAITAVATTLSSVVGIFLGLFLCGLSEGNVTIAQAVIGDVSHKDEKVAHFGWINFFSCLAFILGPLLGGWLSNISYATPFWIGAVLSVAAMGVIWRFSQETKKHTVSAQNFLHAMKEQWDNLLLKKYYIANFFLYFGLYSFWNCIGMYLQKKFSFSTSQIAYVMAYSSFFFALSLLFLVHPLAKKFKPFTSTGWGALFLTAFLALITFPTSPLGLIATIPPMGIIIAIVMTNAAVMVSDAAHEERQGQALGTLQSVQVFAGMSVGIIGGLLAAVKPNLPLLAGAVMSAVCGFLLLRKTIKNIKLR
jgi:DHA1 family tetracycline resistance protein-like MFS transporter